MFGVQQAFTRLLSLQSLLPSTLRFASNSSSSHLAAMDNPDIARIHTFWYDRNPKEWFMPPDGFDSECTSKFGDLVKDARADKLDHWAESKEGSLALLVLLDQFTRNVFRGTTEAFSSDPKAFKIATEAIAKGWDREVSITQALTFYLPLVHTESLIAQVAAVALSENLVHRCEPGSEERQFTEKGSVTSAKQHLDVILKFGRFPSRNEILGRESTEAEKEYLRENPRGFSKAPEAGD